MDSRTFRPIVLSMALAFLVPIAGCTSMTGQTAGQYVDDSTITASVKAKLVGDKIANLTRVDVDTTNKVVSLNGVVESPLSKDTRRATGDAGQRCEPSRKPSADPEKSQLKWASLRIRYGGQSDRGSLRISMSVSCAR